MYNADKMRVSMRKSLFCLFLVLLSLPVFAKAQKEIVEERDWSWLNDEKLAKEKFEHSKELVDKYGHNFCPENFTITLKKSLFKKNTVTIKYNNISDKDLYIFKNDISTNDEFSIINIWYRITDSQNESPSYIGIYAESPLFYEDIDFVLVKAGETINNEVDLGKFFKLDADEVYTVQFDCGDIKSNTITIND